MTNKLLKAILYIVLALVALLLIVIIAAMVTFQTVGSLSPYTQDAIAVLKYVASALAVATVILVLCLKGFGVGIHLPPKI